MSEFTFADRYAQSALSPSAQIITSRQATANRIVENVTQSQIFDLVGAYYGSPHVSLTWFRDEFAKEDASFSLVNNEREMKVLAALILEQLLFKEDPETILAIVAGNAAAQRPPEDASWLLCSAKETLVRLSVDNREPRAVPTEVVPTTNPKLEAEIAGVTNGDWETLLAMLAKMRAENLSSGRNISKQAKESLNALKRELELVKEESQMLWWLFSGHSKTLARSFSFLSAPHAAVAGAIDLGVLTSFSLLGPVAIPGILERMLSGAKKAKTSQPTSLAAIVDGFAVADLEALTANVKDLPPWLAPISTALKLAQTMGTGGWHTRYTTQTGLDASSSIDPLALANQLYREYLLGQFL